MALLAAAACNGERQPNILLILADDLGYGELGCYGQEHIRTPRIDALASRGMRFTQHYAGSPVCAPSRCTLLTGRHTGHASIRDNDEMGERGDVWNDPALEGQRPMPAGEVTLAESLREVGYATGFIGKWGLGWTGSEGDPNAQGFDRFFGFICQRIAHNYYPDHLHADGKRVELRNTRFEAHQKLPESADPTDPSLWPSYDGPDYAPDLLVEEADQFIRAHSQDPFLLVFATPVPHLALQVPADSLEDYSDAFTETPYPGNRGYLPHPTPRAAYAAMITRMDRDVGRLLDTLDDLGIADETLVVFTSDNGPSWVGGCDLDFFNGSGGLRGRKGQLFEGGIRVPLIARWPGRVPPGSVSDHVSAFWDLLPTCLDAARAETPQGLDGLSMMPTLTGNPASQPIHEVLYWEHAQTWQAVRFGNVKALRRSQGAPLQIYDLAVDSAETNDLSASRPDLVEEAEARMATSRTPSVLFPLRQPKPKGPR